jgi:hypothetical protein
VLVDAKDAGMDPDYSRPIEAPNNDVAITEARKWAESYPGMISKILMLSSSDATVPSPSLAKKSISAKRRSRWLDPYFQILYFARIISGLVRPTILVPGSSEWKKLHQPLDRELGLVCNRTFDRYS